jgi:nitric oxide reductase subunit B
MASADRVLLLDVVGGGHRTHAGEASYTNNWPYEPLVGNAPTSSNFMWTVFSVLFLIAGIGLLGWHYAVYHGKDKANRHRRPRSAAQSGDDPVDARHRQVLLGRDGAVPGADPARRRTAHYQVEGQEFYGIAARRDAALFADAHLAYAARGAVDRHRLARYRPVHRAGDLRHEPKFQRLGVNFLFLCLLIIVVGAFAGQWFAVMQKLGLANNFWFGHQGWEYVDIGRFWQVFLFVGLMLWLTLMGRALWPALKRKDEMSSIVGLLFLSTVAIGLFYGAGLMWGEHTHISTSSTGAGGSCTCGWKASSKCSPPP